MNSEEMMPTLFSASQPSAATFFRQEDFEWSLYHNLLFHPTGMVIPDSFIFCPFVYNYLHDSRDPEPSWYEKALELGLLIPYVREKSLSDHEYPFRNLLDKMKENLLQGHFEKGEFIAQRLDRLFGKARTWKGWPDAMGQSFGRLVADRLCSRDTESLVPNNLSGLAAEDLLAFLQRIKPFIADDIEAARHSLPAEHGLRVSEVLWASARRLLGTDISVKNLEDLIAQMKNRHFSEMDIRDTIKFYKALQELYNENLSISFGVSKNITGFDVISRMISAESSQDFEDRDDRPIFVDVQLPPLPLLKVMPFDTFARPLRESRQFAVDYRKSFIAWSGKPEDPDLQRDLIEAVKVYAALIRRTAHGSRNLQAYRISIGLPPIPVRLAGSGALGVALAALEEHVHAGVEHYLTDQTLFYGACTLATVAAVEAARHAEKVIEYSREKIRHGLYIKALHEGRVTIAARPEGTIEVQPALLLRT